MVRITLVTSGQLVRTLALGRKPAGSYISKENAAHWDGRDEKGKQVAPGVYFYRLYTKDYKETSKLVIVR